MNGSLIEGVTGFSVRLSAVTFRPPRFVTKPVLKDVSIEIQEGEVVAVIGENGSGKSSLLAAIAGELSGPWEGDVEIQNALITKQARRLIDGVGIVHQDENADLVPHLNIAANIYIRKLQREFRSPELYKLDDNEALMKKFRTGLAIHARRLQVPIESLVSKLSGGQRQMLNAAIAIHFENEHNPCRLLLLDEHTSKLSSRNALEVLAYIMAEVRRIHCTVVMVTHRLEEVKEYCDRAFVIKDGEIVANLDHAEIREKSIDEIRSLF